MNRSLLGAGLGLSLMTLAAPAAAAMQIDHPWIPAPPLGAITASGFITLKNADPTPEVFLGASTPLAETVEIHAMSMTGGVMRMRRMDGGLALAAKASLSLSPDGGYHLMLVRLKRPLKAGDRIPMTLRFARAGYIKTIFMVEAPSAMRSSPG